jgi:spermidine synthase
MNAPVSAAPAVALFFAGAGAFAAEVLAVRVWSTLLGSGAVASAWVFGATVVLWALGALASGRIAAHRIFRWAALAAALSLVGLALGLPSVRDRAALGFAEGWIAAAVLTAVPAFAAGAAYPAARRAAARVGSGFSLYGAESAGAVAGALGAFLLLASLGTRAALAAAAATFLLAAAVGVGNRAAPPVRPAPVPRSLALLAFATGFVGLAFQVVALRIVSVVFGSAAFASVAVLTAFAAGFAAGAAVGGRLPVRPVRAGTVLGLVLAGSQGAALLLWLLAPVGAGALAHSGGHHAAFLAAELVLTAIAVAPLAAVLGWSFPVIAETATAHGARPLGAAVAANAIGGGVGGVLTGLFILPAFGLRGAAAVPVIAGALALFALPRSRTAVSLTVVSVAVAAVMWASGGLSGVSLLGAARGAEPAVLYNRSGASATVTVSRGYAEGSGWGELRSLFINGKADASNSVFDLSNQQFLAHLPLAAYGGADPNVLVIGLGSGITAGEALRYPAATVTAVELEPRVAEAAEHFGADNNYAVRNPRLSLRFGDGRSFLTQASERFDVITSEPSNPWVAGSGNLFTREFYRTVGQRLAEGGVFVQWLHLYGLDLPSLKSAVATFADAFPHVSLWLTFPGSDILLLSTPEPVPPDGRLPMRFRSEPEVRAALERTGIPGPDDLAGYLLLTDVGVRQFAHGAGLNTDDRPRLEFGAFQNYGRPTQAENLAALAAAVRRTRGEKIPLRLDLALELNRSGTAALVGERLDSALAVGRDRSLVELVSLALFERGTLELRRGAVDAAAERFRRMGELDPDNPWADVGLGDVAAAQNRPDEAVRLALDASRKLPESVRVLASLALAQLKSGDAPGARASARNARNFRTADPFAYAELGVAFAGLGDHVEAAAAFRKSLRLDPNQPEVRRRLLEELSY